MPIRAGRFQTARKGMHLTGLEFGPVRMEEIANSLLRKIRDRISLGRDVYDGPAKPLSESYRKFKMKRGRPPLRNWYLTGITMGHLKVKSVQPNRAVIGFLPGIRRYSVKSKMGSDRTVVLKDRSVSIDLVVRKNQQRCRQWGISPSDMKILLEAVRGKSYWTLARTA